jgi:hypothetical protein
MGDGLGAGLSVACALISARARWLFETGRGPVLRRFFLLR